MGLDNQLNKSVSIVINSQEVGGDSELKTKGCFFGSLLLLLFNFFII